MLNSKHTVKISVLLDLLTNQTHRFVRAATFAHQDRERTPAGALQGPELVLPGGRLILPDNPITTTRTHNFRGTHLPPHPRAGSRGSGRRGHLE